MASELNVGGINGTLGATTPATVAATTISASGAVTVGGASLSVDAVNTFAADTGSWTVRNVRGNHTFAIRDVVAGSDIGTFSSTGLAVTGAVTATTLSTFSGGVAFQSATSSTESGVTGTGYTLDKYEEGTWTPVLNGATGAGATGYYTRIGNLVQISYYSGAFTGTAVVATITGLPFAAGSYQVFTAAHNTWATLSSSGYFATGGSSLTFTNTGATGSSTATTGGGRYLMLSGTYRI